MKGIFAMAAPEHIGADVSSAATTSPQANMPWLWGFVMQHRGATYGALISGVVGGITAALEPYLVGVIVDHIGRGVNIDLIIQDILLLIVMGIATVIAFFGQRHYSGVIAYSVVFDIRRTIFDNLLTQDHSFYQRMPTGDLLSRMNADMDMIWRLLAIGFNRIGSALLTVIVAFMLLATVNFPLTLVVFVVLLVSTIFQLRAGVKLAPLFEKVQDQAGVVAALVQDSASGIQTIKTFGREKGVAENFLGANREFRRTWLFFKRRNEPVGMLPNMISQATTGVVVLFGGILAIQGALTLGNFTQFLIYLGLLSSVLLNLGTIYQRYQQTRGALARLTPLLQSALIKDEAPAKPLPEPRGEIEYQHVTVEMDGITLLSDVSLKIPAGSIAAFVGPTGCGKTLLVNMLARVLDPNEGQVMIDGVDVRALALEELREAIAYVPQSTFLFSRTLEENVRMGKPDISEDELERAIHIARINNDLEQLPHGLETLVGEKGVMLSGGQKQRVAIARALVRDPAILVLDDALSSVDTQTAADILAGLRQVLRSRTSLIIAHRIATVKDADFIVVMDDGQIADQGTHSELIERGGLYSRMVERELKEDAVKREAAKDNAQLEGGEQIERRQRTGA
jgi:ATP-binding cassette subfamily B protein